MECNCFQILSKSKSKIWGGDIFLKEMITKINDGFVYISICDKHTTAIQPTTSLQTVQHIFFVHFYNFNNCHDFFSTSNSLCRTTTMTSTINQPDCHGMAVINQNSFPKRFYCKLVTFRSVVEIIAINVSGQGMNHKNRTQSILNHIN